MSRVNASLRQRFEEVSRGLVEFESEFPLDSDCVDGLFKLLFPSGYMICSNCGQEVSERVSGSRTLRCSGCKTKNWFTAGTGFHKVQKIRARFAIVWLIERGISFNAHLFAKAFEQAESTAWYMLKGINAAIAKNLAESWTLVSANHFRNVICRRSISSQANDHPRTELDKLPNIPEQGELEQVDLDNGHAIDELNLDQHRKPDGIPESEDISTPEGLEQYSIQQQFEECSFSIELDEQERRVWKTLDEGPLNFVSARIVDRLLENRLEAGNKIFPKPARIHGESDTTQSGRFIPS